MRCTPLPLAGAYRLEDAPFADQRGRFARIYCAHELESIGLRKPIAQANISLTRQKGSIRGMHFQTVPHAEIKIIRCLHGAVFDVIIDLRKASETYLQWHGEILSPERAYALYVPEGFAHGFQVIEEDAQLLYLHTDFYTPECEGGVRFDDPAINIAWPLPPRDISDKDRLHALIGTEFQGFDI
ncbi:MAG: dTDP-4-dehydrorhamnose 3,5-epimerase family protein [Pseudodesulfovibrio sp.]|uniref:dTDP-4-dehydrorhamnose 3,5-epimerase n=1 Tax=Pseudodesulfovibrio aespoeensis (strain ATCC 700646 / DSM 10631 / Aspo-2) TaxID=643562 RepID=E6VSB5_PSEA9|nr:MULTISPECIES: dTDP-4-dehydrorhamnose 3,5-epimerase family protein [Pseudodesulfovibrio]MBU4378907.1 dTDP-4-dehydrorhamnose 3,5-epimerase family protein [Pseudomonadota bacterium]ADU64258.1 dTDP-4-dehydrorhamnose 3,5-epimerase [Pseudodesulfovibrio aespoeensis Aspo-2]MBU4516437.1 dTDP-4-dehydrorhamnose 3,5-epimerase family protein [Pseudomonadota bacterium]MBU4523084.1 dTDP-4-dehydrorhamnose 3,5-epimerase family protein [Pseudomonadota bacterium]MBU4558050.1 dTDP-4-dehydrorhamnose 3,5-epimera